MELNETLSEKRMLSMKVSVFVVTYNQERYIEQCLNGIASQEVDFDYEVIVGDDCSTDQTGAICDLFAKNHPNFRIYHHPRNLGHVKNWEFVLNHCTGDYVAMVEGDDYWTDPHKLQRQVDFLETNQDFFLSFHRVKLVYDDAHHQQEHLFEHLEEREYTAREIYETWSVLTSSVVFRNNIGTIEFPNNVFYSDIYLFLILMNHGRAWCHEMCSVAYRRHQGNQSASQAFEPAAKLYEQYRVMEKAFPELHDITYQNKQHYLHLLAYNYLHEKKAVKYMFLYMAKHPAKLFSFRYWKRLVLNIF